MSKYICTVFTDSHLAYALTLWESVRKHGPDWGFVALRVGDGDLPDSVPAEFVSCCIGLDSLEIHPGTKFWYDAFEFCNFLKAPLHKYMSQIDGIEEWWFVDADCQFVGDVDVLSQEWQGSSILLCPHRRAACNVPRAMDLPMLFFGSFNGGLLGLRPSANTDAFIDWFSDRLTFYCFNEPNLGLFVDQKWLDLALCYFETSIVRNPGINVGHWCYSDAHAAQSIEVVLYHFSAINVWDDSLSLNATHSMNDRTQECFLHSAQLYREQVRKWAIAKHGKQYPYDHFCDGTRFNKTMRRAYYLENQDESGIVAPFFDSSAYSALDQYDVHRQFVLQVIQEAYPYARSIFTCAPPLHALSRLYSRDELVRAIRASDLFPALFGRLSKAIASRLYDRKRL